MKFKAYPPSHEFPFAFYVVGKKGIKVTKRQGMLCASGGSAQVNTDIEDELRRIGVNLEKTSMGELKRIFLSKGMLAHSYGAGSSANKDFHESNTYEVKLKKSPDAIIREVSKLDISTCPFRDSTRKEVSVIISSNEPRELLSFFEDSKIFDITMGHLPVADIVATNSATGDTLFIERKTIHDLYDSVTNNQRSHDQSERLFDAVNKLKREGKRARAIWLIEAQTEGQNLIHSSLECVQNVDGLINYFDMINDQSVHQTWSMKHTVYVANKYIQGFFEQKLAYPVKTGNPNIMRSKQERINAKSTSVKNIESGVVRHTSSDLAQMLSYIPAINTKVARNLASTGKSFAEILQMNVDELQKIHGIGDKTAELIYSTFNTRKVD
ncbi:MAG: hypothetical protein CMN72_15835 [Sphingomonas sp.]|nr:hypothetical protein [Sphingomonas sp.]|tara:strand:+ start:1619 stop:2764 length:1146 start_codon:yes stop_codon:yes gene_type:complete